MKSFISLDLVNRLSESCGIFRKESGDLFKNWIIVSFKVSQRKSVISFTVLYLGKHICIVNSTSTAFVIV